MQTQLYEPSIPSCAHVSAMTIVCKLPHVVLDIVAILKSIKQTDADAASSSRFARQTSIRIEKKSIKIFANGSFQATGCKSVADFRAAMQTLFERIRCIESIQFDASVDDLIDVRIAMMSLRFDLPFPIQCRKLHEYISAQNYEHITSIHDKDRHIALRIKTNDRCTFLIYPTGHVIATWGACDLSNDTDMRIRKNGSELIQLIKQCSAAIISVRSLQYRSVVVL